MITPVYNPMMQMSMNMLGCNMRVKYGKATIDRNFFYFNGNSASLQTHLNKMTHEQCQDYQEASITVSGTEVQAANNASLIMTVICGSFLIFPLFFFCMNWWKRCTYAAFSISTNVYQSMYKIFSSPNIRSIHLTVIDNKFDLERARILYNHLQNSTVKSFSFVNKAETYNFIGSEYSQFQENMMPVRQLTNISSDIRWGEPFGS